MKGVLGWAAVFLFGLSLTAWGGEPGGKGDRGGRGERGGQEGQGRPGAGFGGMERPEDYKGDAKGTSSGTVIDVTRDNRLLVQLSDGGRRAFVPMWKGGVPKDGGGYDKAVVEKLGQLNRGDEIEIKWEWQERMRVVDVKVTKASPKGDAKTSARSGADRRSETKSEK